MLRFYCVPGGNGNRSRFVHGGLIRDCRYRREHSVNAALGLVKFYHGLSRYPWRAVRWKRCWVPDAQRRTTIRPAVYHGCQYVPSRPITFWCGPSRFPRSDQGLIRFSRSVKAFYGWNVDTGQPWKDRDFRGIHMLPVPGLISIQTVCILIQLMTQVASSTQKVNGK
jgi:hypothetical protein